MCFRLIRLSVLLSLSELKKKRIARICKISCVTSNCLTTVAAGVHIHSGRDRKKKLETGLLFEVLLLDQQISFENRLFFVTRCPSSRASCYVPEGTNVKKLCKWGVFRVKMCSWSNDVFVELMREEDAKTPVLSIRGELSFHRFLAKEEQRRDGLRRFVGKMPTYTKHPCPWCPLRWRETSRYFSVLARFVWTKPAKKERLSYVSQAARFLDEVEMEVDKIVDGNISREAGRLRIFVDLRTTTCSSTNFHTLEGLQTKSH